jgi:GT2 family glycosyltransferase
MISLSIIIVSYRCWSRLDVCLQSIEGQDVNGIEVIVVDNHSNDGKGIDFSNTHPKVKFIFQDTNAGFAQACNRGAKEAKGEWVLFLNPDTILPANILSPLLNRVKQEPSWKLIGIKQLNDHGKNTHPYGVFLKWWNVWPSIRSLQQLLNPSKSKQRLGKDAVSYPDWISGSFVLIRKIDFEELGGWDERFWMYYEDMDLSKRAADKGWKRVMYNELTCVHSHGGSSRINHDIKALTKSTVIKSAYLYINKYMIGLSRWVAVATLYKITIIDLLLSAPFSSTKRKMIRLFLK